jgi:hypothetical protein
LGAEATGKVHCKYGEGTEDRIQESTNVFLQDSREVRYSSLAVNQLRQNGISNHNYHAVDDKKNASHASIIIGKLYFELATH